MRLSLLFVWKFEWLKSDKIIRMEGEVYLEKDKRELIHTFKDFLKYLWDQCFC